jgi:hypothetical protein
VRAKTSGVGSPARAGRTFGALGVSARHHRMAKSTDPAIMTNAAATTIVAKV